MKRAALKEIRYRLEYGVFLFFYALATPLSANSVFRFGRTLGLMVYRLSRKRRRIAEINLDIAFAQTKSRRERQRIIRNSLFAARFAVKEAVLKSLGTGMGQGISWKDLEVLNHQETGAPCLKLNGKGRDIFEALKLKRIHISISHEKNYAIAHAIAEK